MYTLENFIISKFKKISFINYLKMIKTIIITFKKNFPKIYIYIVLSLSNRIP
jgi:hypothetical protein